MKTQSSIWKWTKRMLISLLTIGLIVVIAGAIVMRQPQFGQPPAGEGLERITTSPQFRDGIFQNEGGITTQMSLFRAFTLLPQVLRAQQTGSPSWSIPVVTHDRETFANTPDSLVRATWFGHSTFLLEIDGKRLLLDPMLGPAASPVAFFGKRFNQQLPIDIEDLPQIDAIVMSHDHYDHLDHSSIVRLRDKVDHFFVPLGLGSHLRHWDIPEEKITEMDWWQEIEYNGLKLACTPSQHFSGRGLGDRASTLWASWAIIGKDRRVYFSGDSGYFRGFQQIGEKYGPFDLTMMECGQYNDLWPEVHMVPEETVQAHLDLRGDVLMPIHWGAFSLAFHSWTDPIERAIKAAEAADVAVATPRIGEQIVLGEQPPQSKWWIQSMQKN